MTKVKMLRLTRERYKMIVDEFKGRYTFPEWKDLEPAPKEEEIVEQYTSKW
jgi:hypothetical protein